MLDGIPFGVGVDNGNDVKAVWHIDVVFAYIAVSSHANMLNLIFVYSVLWLLEHVIASGLDLDEDYFSAVSGYDVNFMAAVKPPVAMQNLVIVFHKILRGEVFT